jgi:hypothetical protein
MPTTVSGVFVEIGSDRDDGSTVWLDALAHDYNTKLISVDVLPDAGTALSSRCVDTEFVVDTGSAWAQKFSTSGLGISVLYLDNFDYIWDINAVSPAIQYQMAQYATRGVTMTNQNCQIEHMRQIVSLLPCLNNDAVVAVDDTYCYNDCWIGKCGPAVVYLLSHGFEVVHQTLDCGVILTRTKK